MSDFEGALGFFRTQQAVQFTATADIVRPVGEPEYNEATGAVAQPVETVDVDVPCKLKSNDRSGNDVEAGDTEARLVDHALLFPVETDIQKDDLVTLVTSTYNPTDEGRQFRITDVDRREWQVARRCVIEEVLVPLLNEGS